MGVFDVHCVVSGLALTDKVYLVLLASADEGPFIPVSIPLSGTYNRYGSIDMIAMGANAEAIDGVREEVQCEDPTDLETMFQSLNRGVTEFEWGRWKGHRVSFALIDGGVYEAAVDTAADKVANNARLSWDALFQEAFGDAAMARRIYQQADTSALLKPLAKFLAFLQSGEDLQPINVEDSNQYCGLVGDYGCAARVEVARKKFANQPGMLKAVEDNAAAWRELDEDDE